MRLTVGQAEEIRQQVARVRCGEAWEPGTWADSVESLLDEINAQDAAISAHGDEIGDLQEKLANASLAIDEVESLHWELSTVVGRHGCVGQAQCGWWPCPTHTAIGRYRDTE